MTTINAAEFDLSTPAGRLVYADWLEENGQPEEALVQRVLGRPYGPNQKRIARALGLTPPAIQQAGLWEGSTWSRQRSSEWDGQRWHWDMETEEDCARRLLAWVREPERWARILHADRAIRARERCKPTPQQVRDREVRRTARRAANRVPAPLCEEIRVWREDARIITAPPTGRRLKVRSVGIREAARDARQRALESGKWRAVCRHGGDVNNSYGYPAETEAVLAVSDPRGRVVVWFRRLPANKVTLGGAAGACLEYARPLWDARYGKVAEQEAWRQIKRVHALVRFTRAWRFEEK